MARRRCRHGARSGKARSEVSSVRERFVDVLVAGAGPAGATIARLLARQGRCVWLVDPGTRHVDRLEIIAPAACGVVEALGIVHLLDDALIARPCPGIRRRWGTPEIEIDDFLRRPGGRGFVIDRAPFDETLRRMARDAGVVCLTGRVVAARREGEAVVGKIESGSKEFGISTGLVIDATGRPSVVARRMGARRLVSERLVAERQHVDASPPTSGPDAAWLDVEGHRGGWSYAVSGPGERRDRWAIYAPEQRPHDRSSMRADASSALLSRAAGEGWIAIGDAAASFDPVTSQGLVNALSTAHVAAGAVLSPGGLDHDARAAYSDAVAATFHYSEAGRARIYGALVRWRGVASFEPMGSRGVHVTRS
jgi:flavin-dependent dehydrogenase